MYGDGTHGTCKLYIYIYIIIQPTTPEFTDRFNEGRCNVNVCNVQIMVINVYYGLDRKHTKTHCYYHLHVAQHSTTCMSNGPSMYTSIKQQGHKLPQDPSLTEYCAKNIHNIPVSQCNCNTFCKKGEGRGLGTVVKSMFVDG